MYGHRLKELRREKNLTIYEFAEKIGIKGPTYHGYEKTHRKPPLDVLIRISEHCNVSVDWLLGLTEDRNKHHLQKELSSVIESSEITWHGIPLTKEQLKPISEILELIVRDRIFEKKTLNKKEILV